MKFDISHCSSKSGLQEDRSVKTADAFVNPFIPLYAEFVRLFDTLWNLITTQDEGINTVCENLTIYLDLPQFFHRSIELEDIT